MTCILTIVAYRPLFHPRHAPIHSDTFPSVIDVTDFSVRCEDNQDIIYVGC